MSIIRWATCRIISRTKSTSAPFSASSVNAIVLLLVVIVCLCVEVVGLVTPTITGKHDDRRPSSAAYGRVCPTVSELNSDQELIHHLAGHDPLARVVSAFGE